MSLILHVTTGDIINYGKLLINGLGWRSNYWCTIFHI